MAEPTGKKQPDYVANAVVKRDGREYWTRIGAVFKNDNPDHPLTLLINPGVAVSEKIVLSVPKAKEETQASA